MRYIVILKNNLKHFLYIKSVLKEKINMSLILHFKIDLYGSYCIKYLNQIHVLYTNR